MTANEDLITLAQATKFWPGRPHVSTLWRACRRGIVAANGERIRLEHGRYGGKIFTSREAIARFGEAIAKADVAHFERQDAHTRFIVRRAQTAPRCAVGVAAASAELDRAGI